MSKKCSMFEISMFEILAEVDILALLRCLSVLFIGMYVWKNLQCITEISVNMHFDRVNMQFQHKVV